MPRAIWKGAISFGMVTIPVSLATVVDEQDVRFTMLHRKCMTRPRQQRWCEVDQEVVPYEDLVRAYEWAPGEYVPMEESDFEKVQVESNRRIDIERFVPLEQINPVYFDNSYFLYPDRIGAKAYELLRLALEGDQRVAIAKVTMRQREYLCAIRLYGEALLLNTLYYHDEIRAVDQEALPQEALSEQEIEMAKMLINVMSGDFEPDRYQDDYRIGLLEIIERKKDGRIIELKPALPAAPAATDLLASLRASLEGLKQTQTVEVATEAPQEAPARRRRKAS